MREDMAKVIVERPRLGGGLSYPRSQNWRTKDPEMHPRREGIKRPWILNSWQKSLNENLAPLKRFLASNVGRPWSKVRSELRERVNMDSAVQYHIWQHVSDFVSEHVVVHQTKKGVWYEEAGGFRWRSMANELVVDPRNGLLVRNKQYRRRWYATEQKKEKLDPAKVVEGRVFKRIEGIWFEIRVGDTRKLESNVEVIDVVTHKRLSELPRHERLELYGNETWYATWKQQLGKREIKRLKLNEEK